MEKKASGGRLKWLLLWMVLVGALHMNLHGQSAGMLSGKAYPVDHHAGLQQLLDSAGLEGVILVYDPDGQTLWTNDISQACRGKLPASTFKIPNSMIALETGVVKDEHVLFPWDGSRRPLPQWEQDMVFREAFHLSCVPCYQELARMIGTRRMKHWLEEIGYGNMDVQAANIDSFWLEGQSRISPLEQLEFLVRFYFGNLPLAETTMDVMRRLMVIEKNHSWQLSGKTGWAIRQAHHTGWFTGYLEKEGKVFFVVSCVEPATAFDMQMFHLVRQDISMEAFRLLNILPD